MALVDIRPAERLAIALPGNHHIGLDRDFLRYARSDGQGRITVRDVADDREFADLPGLPEPGGHVFRIRFSSDGRYLAAAHNKPHVVRVWDIRRVRERLAAMDLDGRESDGDATRPASP